MKTQFYAIFLVAFILNIVSCKRIENNKELLSVKSEDINNRLEQEHLVMSTLWFQQSAEMRAVYYQAYNFAKLALENNLTKLDTSSTKQAVVILDIDETILDNSPFEAMCIKTGLGYTGENWKNWTDLASAKVLPGAIDFLLHAKAKGVKAIYVSNRREEELERTMKNMKNLGFPFVEKANFFLRTEESSKTKRREKILKKYDIVLLIGDNLADFSDIYESRNEKLALDVVDANKNDFGTKYIILPNPMYGDWEKAIYKNDYSLSTEHKDSLRKASLIAY